MNRWNLKFNGMIQQTLSDKTDLSRKGVSSIDQSIVSQRVKPKEAAKEIGCCVPYMYEMMRIGKWDLGDYVKPRGRKKATVFIFRDKLDKFLGKELPPCEQQETSQPQQA